MFKRIPTPVIYTVAGTGLSALTGVGGYFLGVRRTRAKFFGQMAVENLVLTGESAPQGEFDFMGKLPVREGIDEIMRKYGPHHDPSEGYDYAGVADFERVATPMADEILGKTEVVEPMVLVPEDYPDDDWSEEEIQEVLDAVKEADAEAPDDPVAMVHNIFAASSADQNWDYEAELFARVPYRPYVLHQDEFINQDSGFEQSTLTYFAKDGVVVDELNQPLEDWVSTLGALIFGHGTTDANAVYIRNEKLNHEFEVLLSTGSYLDEVIGQEAELAIEQDEIKHSMNLKMRRE